MTEFKLILQTYWWFYRRHIGLLLLFFVGFSLGSALLTAIQGLNLEASKRYQSTTAMINNPVTHFIRPALGEHDLPFSLWTQLRQQGVTAAQPVVEGWAKTQTGASVNIRGVNLFQWLGAANNDSSQSVERSHTNVATLTFVNAIYLDPSVMKRLNLSAEHPTLSFNDSIKNIPVVAMKGLGGSALMDIYLADQLLNKNGQISYFEVTEQSTEQQTIITTLLKNGERLEPVQEQAFDGLSRAFFLNLKALALLGYVVGAFLSFNAIKLAYTSRQTLQNQLFVLGCSEQMLTKTLLTEFTVLSFVAAIFGALLGTSLANFLVLDVSYTLQSLYQLDRTLIVQFDWSLVLLGFVLNLLVLLCFVFIQTRNSLFNSPLLKIGSVLLVMMASGYLYLFAVTEVEALLLCMGVLLLFFGITPWFIRRVFLIKWPTKNAVLLWLKADSSTQLSALTSSVLAMLMAMGAAVGMQIMVGSFSDALDKHLTQRLSADLYVRPAGDFEQLKKELVNHQSVAQVGVYWHAPVEVRTLMQNERGTTPSDNKKAAAKLISFGEASQYHQHLNLLGDESVAPYHFVINDTERGCLINEPGLRKYALSTGDRVLIEQGDTYIRCVITGVFYDYGEQALTLVTTTHEIAKSGIQFERYGLSLWLNEGANTSTLRDELMTHYGLDSAQVVANKQFKAFAKTLFKSTFYITNALNSFIILIALFGMWVSFLTLGRQQLEPITVLQRLGVSNKSLLLAKLLQTGVIIGATLALAIPLGLSLGWVLLKYVMPIAFGWSMALTVNWVEIGLFSVVIFIFALISCAVPLSKVLLRGTPNEHVAL
ncbi:ABC transporter permease [Pseudoalteromonas aurantia]|uniref:ABC transporter permease n=1 Tax=Pseudoalteromonas aurantia TaxID=43654 RepID=A0ABY2W345_9GAMM|nr:ABC transporter permease [Pseudoalteromonas aurantia]TMO79048.1 ABC transporter permease [Pseudoalteromonas aurantia]